MESFSVAIAANPGNGWLGFTNSLFDEMRITSTGNAALSIDSLQMNAVPVPGTFSRVGLAGLAGLGALRGRKP